MSKEYWNKEHKNNKSLYKAKMAVKINDIKNDIQKGYVLDLGIGSGRNSLWFARNGYSVEGCDISKSSVEGLNEISTEEDLDLFVEVKDLRELDLTPNKYKFIICSFVLNFFIKSEVDEILLKLVDALDSGGYIYIGVFSDKDPVYGPLLQARENIEENTFFLHERESYCFLLSSEYMTKFFQSFEPIRLDEETYVEDYGNRNTRSIIEYIGKK